jgi:hypothetical protein
MSLPSPFGICGQSYAAIIFVTTIIIIIIITAVVAVVVVVVVAAVVVVVAGSFQMSRICSTHGENRNAYTILAGKPEGKRPLGTHRLRWEDGS